jgi:photosynthetic reaction center cytochrome c subunit
MEAVINPRILAGKVEDNVPPAPEPPAAPIPTKASQVYQNVQVLGDLSITEFNRLMLAISKWVASDLPDAERCNYCHLPDNRASDDKYTKVVARSMLKLTLHTNSEWKSHVAGTGVTCYTCHRGKNVPANVWTTDPGPGQPERLNPTGQNVASATAAYASLPYDPLTPFLEQDYPIGVISRDALPPSGDTSRKSIKQAEWTYGLMMHISDSLGVNCTFCHNSRSFFDWDQSPPQRTTAWYAIRHVRDINENYINPLADILPANRKGPLGDPQKASCATCHQGAYKPLYGVSMLKDYPELAGAPTADVAAAPGATAVAEPAPAPAPVAEAQAVSEPAPAAAPTPAEIPPSVPVPAPPAAPEMAPAPAAAQSAPPQAPQPMTPQMPQQTAPPMSQQTAPPMPQQTAPPMSQQTAPPMPQQTAPPMPQQMAPQMPQQMAPQMRQPMAPPMQMPAPSPSPGGQQY